MRPSIRKKLLLSIAGIMLLFGAALIILNSTLLETYYTSREKNMLRKQTAIIEAVIRTSEDYSGLSSELEQIERRNNLAVSIIGSDGMPRYFTRIGIMDSHSDRPPTSDYFPRRGRSP